MEYFPVKQFSFHLKVLKQEMEIVTFVFTFAIFRRFLTKKAQSSFYSIYSSLLFLEFS